MSLGLWVCVLASERGGPTGTGLLFNVNDEGVDVLGTLGPPGQRLQGVTGDEDGVLSYASGGNAGGAVDQDLGRHGGSQRRRPGEVGRRRGLVLGLVRLQHADLAPLVEEEEDDGQPDDEHQHDDHNLFVTHHQGSWRVRRHVHRFAAIGCTRQGS